MAVQPIEHLSERLFWYRKDRGCLVVPVAEVDGVRAVQPPEELAALLV
jgi:hypothetical protein